MAKFRKKPVVIEAEQFFINGIWPEGVLRDPGDHQGAYISTLEGRMTVSEGDWVIVGVAGERYPCKPAIFEATYEAVIDNDNKETL